MLDYTHIVLLLLAWYCSVLYDHFRVGVKAHNLKINEIRCEKTGIRGFPTRSDPNHAVRGTFI